MYSLHIVGIFLSLMAKELSLTKPLFRIAQAAFKEYE